MYSRISKFRFKLHYHYNVQNSPKLDPILRLMSPVTRSDFVSDLFGDDISGVECRLFGAALCSSGSLETLKKERIVAKVEVLSPQISSPSPTTKTRFLSFNRTQSRAVIGLPTGHNTLRTIFT